MSQDHNTGTLALKVLMAYGWLPNERGVLVIDETGDRKDGHKTAHVSRQYLANLGKIDNGVVSVSSLWADERVYYPVDVEGWQTRNSSMSVAGGGYLWFRDGA